MDEPEQVKSLPYGRVCCCSSLAVLNVYVSFLRLVDVYVLVTSGKMLNEASNFLYTGRGTNYFAKLFFVV